MPEAVDAVTDYWFNVLRFPVLRVAKAVANTASRRISERTGMRIIATGDKDFVSCRLPTETWETTVEVWHLHRAARHQPAAVLASKPTT